MGNAIMDAVEALTTRASAVTLDDPAPPDAAIDTMLAAAARAPDHGKLRPWRFVTIRGDARRDLGSLLEASLRRRDPDMVDLAYERERAKATRAPVIIVVVGKVQPDHPKIPEIEQVMSAACAAHSIMLAAHAQGYGCMWKTGGPAYDAQIKRALGLDGHDHIVGFLYVGKLVAATPDHVKRPDFRELVVEWTGSHAMAAD